MRAKETPVSEVMVSPAIVATMDSTVEECMRLMTANRVRHLAIVDRDKVAGVVSVGDLVKSTISTQAETIDRLQDYITGKYPG
jgi:CBS domain-containing protein